jgi:hypothetical protein
MVQAGRYIMRKLRAYLGCSSKKAEANNRKPKFFLRGLRIASVPTKLFAYDTYTAHKVSNLIDVDMLQ